jgi:small subunit ribosomal protein S6
VLVEFTAEPKASAELDRHLTLSDEVMRHKIIRLPDKVAGRKRPAAAAAPAPAAG